MAAKATEITSFGVWVRDRRRVLDLTQEELADRVGCSVSAIRKIEGDLRRPSEQVAELLGRVLEVEPAQQALFLKVARGVLSFTRLETIAPLGGRALPIAAPPAQPAAEQPVHQVPVPGTPLVGRESELAQIEAIFADPACRLLTITGPGGIGKTRLALEAARRLQESPATTFADGAVFVGLAAIARGEELPQSVAAAVGLSLRGAESAGDQVIHDLRRRSLLLLLDNFEHVVEGAEWLANLLARAPGVRLLVTSRERLNLQSEWILDIQGLPVPADDASAVGGPLPGGSSAMALFAGCARRVSSTFALTPDDAPHVARICRLLGGMPLAIELAASWVHVLSCAEIAAEIERNVDFLVSTARDLPARHRSLRAAFDHSWRLLDDAQRGALVRLSVFRGGFLREAAATVAQAPLAVLLALVDKSLVRRAGGDRFDLHEVVRQYAGEHLASEQAESDPAGAQDAVRRAHAVYCAALVERARAELRGAQLLTWQRRLDDERDNLNVALDWAVGSGDAVLAAQLAGGLWRYWWLRGAVAEGRRWMDVVIALAERSPAPPTQRAQAMLYHGAGVLARVQGDFPHARTLHEQALALRRALSDQTGVAASLNSLGLIAMFQGDYAQAEAWFAESLDLHTQQGSTRERLTALNNLGVVRMYQGDVAAARRFHEETLAASRRLDDRRGIGTGLGNLGDVLSYQGDFTGSRRALEESLAILREFDDRASVATTLFSLGRLALCDRTPAEAEAAFRACLPLFRNVGDKVAIADTLEGMAQAAERRADPARAARLLGAAQRLRALLGAPVPLVDRPLVEAHTASLRATLGEEAFGVALAAGSAFRFEEAIDFALS